MTEYVSYTHPNTGNNRHEDEYRRIHKYSDNGKCNNCYVIRGNIRCDKCLMRYCSHTCRYIHSARHIDVCAWRVNKMWEKNPKLDVPVNNVNDANDISPMGWPDIIDYEPTKPNNTNTPPKADLTGVLDNNAFMKSMAAIHGKFNTNGSGRAIVQVFAEATRHHTRSFYHGTFTYTITRAMDMDIIAQGLDSAIVVVRQGDEKAGRSLKIRPSECARACNDFIKDGYDLTVFSVGNAVGFVADDAGEMEFCDTPDIDWLLNTMMMEVRDA